MRIDGTPIALRLVVVAGVVQLSELGADDDIPAATAGLSGPPISMMRLMSGDPQALIRAGEIQMDGVVLAFALAIAVVVALLLSFAPRVGREHQLSSELTAGSTRTTGSGRRRRLQQALVVTQIAVSVILLTGAGLLVQSMKRLAAVDPGLDTRNVLTMEVPADFAAITSNEKTIAQYERMATELKAITGVQVVGLGSNVPLRTTEFQIDIKAEGRALNPGEPQPQAEFRTADPGYFRASGMKLAAGRDFTIADRAKTQRVAIVNQTLERELRPGEVSLDELERAFRETEIEISSPPLAPVAPDLAAPAPQAPQAATA